MLGTIGVYKIKKNTYSWEFHILVGGIDLMLENIDADYCLNLPPWFMLSNINISVYRHLKQSLPSISEPKKLVEKIK